MLSTRPLGSFIGTDDEQQIAEAISRFVCKDRDVEMFLKNKAFEFERRDKSRTYLVLNKERLLCGEFELIAYFTLSLKTLEFREAISRNKVKELDGFSKAVGGVAIVLIGQFGKDAEIALDVSGKDILGLCLDKLYQVHKLVGGRYVLIECRDIEKVVGFYEKNGFTLLQTDESDNYLQMVRRL